MHQSSLYLCSSVVCIRRPGEIEFGVRTSATPETISVAAKKHSTLSLYQALLVKS